MDGLEPPNLVEKWGLKSSVNNDLSNSHGIMKEPEEHQFQMDLIGNFLDKAGIFLPISLRKKAEEIKTTKMD